jgi:hypothetical protein
VPIGAGIVGGWLLTRARPARTPADNAPWWDKHGVLECAWGLAAGLVAGVAVAVLAWLSGGSLGGGRMSVVGPAGGWVLLAGVLEIGVVAAATMWTLRWRDRRAEPSDAAR